MLNLKAATAGVAMLGVVTAAALTCTTPAVATSAASATVSGTQDEARARSGPDVRQPGETADPYAVVIAPDGTRITGFSPTRRGLGLSGKAGARAADGQARISAVDVTLAVEGARLRASVPSGRVLAYAYYGMNLWANCQIPGRDGYIWGYMSLLTNRGWINGWMRGDLWYVTQHTGPGGNHPPSGVVPWC